MFGSGLVFTVVVEIVSGGLLVNIAYPEFSYTQKLNPDLVYPGALNFTYNCLHIDLWF